MVGSNEKLRVLRRIPEIRFDEELRGYNKHQVDRVLENLAPLADEVDSLVDRLSEAERRAAAAEARVMEGGGPAPTQMPPVAAPVIPPPTTENFDETLSKTLLLAQRTADSTVQEAQDQAAQIRTEAEAEASATREAVDVEAASMRRAAQDERAASIEEANRDVAAMIDAARTTIDAKVAEAEAELAESHAATRDELVEQIAALQLARDALALDVEHFEGHLSARREVIRSALSDLNDVVEHPERLRTVMPPSPVAEAPDLAPVEPVGIGVASLDSLASEVTDDAESQGVLAPDFAPVSTTDGLEEESHGTWADGEASWADESANEEALSAGLMIDSPTADDEGEPTMAVPVVEPEPPVGELPIRPSTRDADLGATIDEPSMETRSGPATDTSGFGVVAGGEVDDDASSDPFLDELRRVTSDDEDDEALSKFLTESDAEDDDSKGGWFGRRK